MKALLLTGGLGTRLRPLTNTRPKPLLPIVDRPHIEHVLDLLERHGVDDVVLTTAYLPEALAPAAAAARDRGLRVDITHEVEPLGTAGAIRNAAAILGDEPFFVMNGDVLTDVDLGKIASFHAASGGVATIYLVPVEDPSRFGVVPTDSSGRVTGFIEKPPRETAPTNHINAGIYVLDPSVLESIPEGRACSIEREVFPSLVASDSGVFARVFPSYWIDVGTPNSFLQANMDTLAGHFQTNVRVDGGNFVAGDAQVATSARISSSCIGPGSIVADDASITGSVLLPRVRVGAGAVIHGSILGEAAVVPEGARIEGATIGDNETIEGDAR